MRQRGANFARMNSESDILHIVVAGGSGSRFGSDLPKQFCDLDGRPVLMETIDRLRRYGRGGKVVTVINRDMRHLWEELCREHGFEIPPIADGGATRFHSVRNAIEAFGAGARWIAVHDGARPNVGEAVISGVLDALGDGAEAAVPAIPLTDSVRKVCACGGSSAVDRGCLRAVQTPQGFDGELLRRAYSVDYREEFTDDASVVEASGAHVTLTMGSPYNIKITHAPDIDVVRMYMSRQCF